MNLKEIVEYFKGREEVSALYLYGEPGGSSIAVLLKDAGRAKRGAEAIEREYRAALAGFLGRKMELVALNTAPARVKYSVISTGELLFDRNGWFRERFIEQAVKEYLDLMPAGAGMAEKDGEPGGRRARALRR